MPAIQPYQESAIQSKRLLWLRERFGWMGSHSGYDQVCEAIESLQSDGYSSVWREPNKPLPKGSKRVLSYFSKKVVTSPFYDLHSSAADLAALWHCWRQRNDLVHITYAENNLGLLPNFKRSLSFQLIATAHQPASWWRLMHSHPKSVASLDALIVLSKREVDYFQEFLGDRVHFIPHGVDTKFFCPSEPDISINSTNAPRCVFSGTWLRDLQTLAYVIDEVLAKNPGIQFDMIVPHSKRKDPYFYRIARHHQVHWYANISDEHLRSIYQQASILFLPLLDCTANNAILEATACGLPILSNTVGGLTHYTQPTFAQLLPIGDVNGFTTAILEQVEHQTYLETAAKAARSFAEQHLDWRQIAQQTLNLYEQVINEESFE
jgi:glycosyltransferase involved in cell wall biosynthesis